MGWRRVAAWLAGVLLLVVACAGLALHIFVDPERLKRTAHDKAMQAWSRDLAIGEMSLSLFPRPAVTASSVALANPPWAKNRNLLQAESLTAHLEILPLLVGKARVSGLELDGVRLALEQGSDGRGSWELAPAKPAAAPRSEEASELLSLESVEITNADIVYRAKAGPPEILHVDSAAAQADGGLRNVRIEARVARKQRPLALKAAFEDLSRAGRPGATTDATIELDWGRTRLNAAGRVPLERGLKGAAVKADFDSTSFDDMLAFFDVKHGRTAAAKAHVEVRENQGAAEVTRYAGALGAFNFSGDAKISRTAKKTTVKGRIEGDRLDWARLLLDAGFPERPGLEPDELFRDNPLAWPELVSLQGSDGAIDVRLKAFILRNRVELRNVRTHAAFDGDHLELKPLDVETLGGTASGSLAFEGRKKLVRANLEGTGLLLERWFRERGEAIPFTGGPMKIKATFTSTGNSMKALAATVTGPITIRMGPGVWASEKAGHAEGMMSAFSGKDASAIEFECLGASLPFANGHAESKAILGARSTASQLVTSGFIDMRDETLDLRGRVQPKSGKVGLATIAGDIRIDGKIRHPHASLDPVATPAAIVRGAAAIATAGLSLVGTAMADAEHARKSDACEAVFTMR